MSKVLLKIRILLESIFLWLGEAGAWLIMAMYFYSPVEEHFGQSGGFVFYVILTLLEIIIAIWILTEHRKDLKEQITTGNYIILNVISFLAIGIFVVLYISSFD